MDEQLEKIDTIWKFVVGDLPKCERSISQFTCNNTCNYLPFQPHAREKTSGKRYYKAGKKWRYGIERRESDGVNGKIF